MDLIVHWQVQDLPIPPPAVVKGTVIMTWPVAYWVLVAVAGRDFEPEGLKTHQSRCLLVDVLADMVEVN
jgi:hypothetical protein